MRKTSTSASMSFVLISYKNVLRNFVDRLINTLLQAESAKLHKYSTVLDHKYVFTQLDDVEILVF